MKYRGCNYHISMSVFFCSLSSSFSLDSAEAIEKLIKENTQSKPESPRPSELLKVVVGFWFPVFPMYTTAVLHMTNTDSICSILEFPLGLCIRRLSHPSSVESWLIYFLRLSSMSLKSLSAACDICTCWCTCVFWGMLVVVVRCFSWSWSTLVSLCVRVWSSSVVLGWPVRSRALLSISLSTPKVPLS